MLLMYIPLVNIVMMFVFAFSGSKKSKKNFFKAMLIMVLIVTGISLILGIVVGIIGAVAGGGVMVWLSELLDSSSGYYY